MINPPHDQDDLADASLPRDPDFDDVPAELLAIATDPADPDGTARMVAVVIAPEFFGHARRLREGFFDQPDDAS